ncbi:MAG: DNA mismatch repair protein MutS [Limnobacter sp.]|nr:DNA mismatch repair protein MutS [Limnobacter sp.]
MVKGSKSFQDLSPLKKQLQNERQANVQQKEEKRLQAGKQAKAQAESHTKAEEEAKLFRSAMQGVQPLKQKTGLHLPPGGTKTGAKPPPLPLQRLQDDARVLQEALSDEWDVEHYLQTDDTLCYQRNGVSAETVRKLRRGQWVVQGQLDLHGHRTDEARVAVAEFVKSSVKHGLRCVRIIHGKGLGSSGKTPVLKEKVKRWLVQKQEILAFCQAPPQDGGGGALLVLLAKCSQSHT